MYFNGQDIGYSTRAVDLDAIGAAVALVGDSLTDLSISALSTDSRGQKTNYMELTGSLRQLQSLERVRQLTIPWVFLMGLSPGGGRSMWNQLPRNIEELTLLKDVQYAEQSGWYSRRQGLRRSSDGRSGDHRCCRYTRLETLLGEVAAMDRAEIRYLRTMHLCWQMGEDAWDKKRFRTFGYMCRWKQICVTWEPDSFHSPISEFLNLSLT